MSDERKIEVSRRAEIVVPQVPNFIKMDGVSHSIADFSDEELKKIAEAWKQRLIERAAEVRKIRLKEHGL